MDLEYILQGQAPYKFAFLTFVSVKFAKILSSLQWTPYFNWGGGVPANIQYFSG